MTFNRDGVVRGPDGVARFGNLDESVVAMLRRSTERDPDHEAIVEVGGERLTYRELWDRSTRVAGGLRAAGVKPGERVAIRYPNGVPWVLAYFGTLLAGGVAVPVNTRFAAPEVAYVVADCGAGYVFGPDAALPDGEPYVDETIGRHDLAAIFYTSGTTGFPKGAMQTHENLLTNCENTLRAAQVPAYLPEARNLVAVPLFHVTGCNGQLLVTVAVGGTSVVMPGFDVREFLRLIPAERISVLTAVPAMYWLAVNQPDVADFDMSGIGWAIYGGAPMGPSLVRRVREHLPAARLGNGFGLTETTALCTLLPHEYTESHPGSVGFPAPVVDLDLAHPDPATGVGELLARGANVVRGYWNKPEATAEAFRDGWLHTGDLARIDADGLVYVVDRAKDVINRGGENVYSVEVENALAAAPGVFEVAVVGVPDEMMGEKVGAVIVPTPGGTFDLGGTLDFARERLADFKVPQYVVVRGQPLPRNPGGKVLKPVLRKETEWGPLVGRSAV